MPIFSSLYGARLDRELGTDDSTVLFTTARRKAAINEGQAEFADLTECLLQQSSLTVTSTASEYDLNTLLTNFARFQKQQVVFRYINASSVVTVLSGDDLPRKDPAWLDRYEPQWQVSTVADLSEQWPQVWYSRTAGSAVYLGFWPAPSSGSSCAMEATVPYVMRPTAMSSDTAEPFQISGSVRSDLVPYHQALVHYAAHQLEKLRRDDQASDRQLQKFLGYVAKYTNAMRIKGGQVLTQTREYFSRRGDRGQDPRT